MQIHQMDVVTAFLNGTLDEEIYMEQPQGFVKAGEEGLVCKLNKSLYGLKQSPRCWNKVFDEYMHSIGYQQSCADPCVYIKHAGAAVSICAVYVDDLILITQSGDEMADLKECLSERFNMTDMGKLHYCLGVSVVHDEKQGCLWLHQKQYIQNMLDKFDLADANTVATPADCNVKLRKSDGISKDVEAVHYQYMVGSLLYAAMETWPDIAQAVGVVSKFNSKPTQEHLTAVKRILRYLKGTQDLGLKFQKTDGQLTGYSDADWAGDLDDRHSTSGNLFVMTGGAVSWMSKKQATVALSTTEAEYVALCSATQEAIWLRRLLGDLDGDLVNGPTRILGDNQGAIAIGQNPVAHARTKHIDIKHHFVREAIHMGTIHLQYCSTTEMVADLLTKPLCKGQFEKLRESMGMFAM